MLSEKLKMDKTSKIILIILIAYFIVMAVIFGPYYYRKMHDKIYIITGNYKIKYTLDKWEIMNDSSDYVLKKFKMYEDSSYKGDYDIMYLNGIQLLDENNKKLDSNGYLFGYRGNIKLKYYYGLNNNEDTSKLSDDLLENIKEKLDIEDIKSYKVISKIAIAEKGIDIYSISNNNAIIESDTLDGISNNNDKKFSVLFYVNNGEIKIIDKILGESDPDIFNVYDIFDLYEDDKLEMVYSITPVQTSSDCIRIYNLSKNKKVKDFCD